MRAPVGVVQYIRWQERTTQRSVNVSEDTNDSRLMSHEIETTSFLKSWLTWELRIAVVEI
jgi:hypothetical protein